jgi:hypothetical protein
MEHCWEKRFLTSFENSLFDLNLLLLFFFNSSQSIFFVLLFISFNCIDFLLLYSFMFSDSFFNLFLLSPFFVFLFLLDFSPSLPLFILFLHSIKNFLLPLCFFFLIFSKPCQMSLNSFLSSNNLFYLSNNHIILSFFLPCLWFLNMSLW